MAGRKQLQELETCDGKDSGAGYLEQSWLEQCLPGLELCLARERYC